MNINVIYCSMHRGFFFVHSMKKSKHKYTQNCGAYNAHTLHVWCVHAFLFYLQLAPYTIYFLMITIIPIILEFLHCSYKKTYRYTRLWTRNTLRSFHKIRVSVTFQFFSLLTAKRNLNREYALDNCLIASQCSVSSSAFLITS